MGEVQKKIGNYLNNHLNIRDVKTSFRANGSYMVKR